MKFSRQDTVQHTYIFVGDRSFIRLSFFFSLFLSFLHGWSTRWCWRRRGPR